MNVFWSWQSDTPERENRALVREALTEALAQVALDLELEDADRPELDHATKNVPGMAEIANTILTKIADCAVFVADVTPIGRSAAGKALPNPNVMIELGWALNRPGWERIIAVLNTADGWTPENLPFDIRHRRTLTYGLAAGADTAALRTARRGLARDLTAAIRANLAHRLEEMAAEVPATGVAALDGERSVWATADATIEHHDSMSRTHRRNIALASGPRAYIRIIPAGWRSRPPAVSDIAGLKQGTEVQPPAEGSMSGDLGATAEGHVRYWITGHSQDGGSETGNVVMYFDQTGEFWVLHGTAVGEARDYKMLRVEAVVAYWAKAMRKAFHLFDSFGATATRRVEIGLTGMQDVRWPGAYGSDSPPARRPMLFHERQSREWTHADQKAFLEEACANITDLFGRSPADNARFRQIFRQMDEDVGEDDGRPSAA